MSFARRYHPFMVNTVVASSVRNICMIPNRDPRRPGRSFYGETVGTADGLRLLPYESYDGGSERYRKSGASLGAAGVNYILGVPTSDDVMLNYQTNAYHDIGTIREVSVCVPYRHLNAGWNEMGDYGKWKTDGKKSRRPNCIYEERTVSICLDRRK